VLDVARPGRFVLIVQGADRSDRPDREQGDAVSQTDPAAIETEIEATRARLAGTVDELAVRLHPKEIGRRSVADFKARVRAATRTPDGSLRVERVGAVVLAVGAVLGLLVLARRRRS
jgi:hypothetical protein